MKSRPARALDKFTDLANNSHQTQPIEIWKYPENSTRNQFLSAKSNHSLKITIMSESLIEIDSALVASDTQEVKVALESEAPLIESSSKRRLEDDDLQLDGDIEDEDAVRSSNKKFCAENDTLTAGNDQDVMHCHDIIELVLAILQ